MDVLLQDLRYALRALRRTPGYTAVVVAVMALGIGLNTMVFTMVYGVLYRPMPLPESARLAYFEHFDAKHDNDQGLSFKMFRDLRTRLKSVERLGGYWDHNAFVTIDREPERFFAATVTHDLFDALGVKPILGRAFTAEQEQMGPNWLPVVISARMWKNRFQSDPQVLGKSLRLNGRTRTIVGVMPEGFLWPETQDFWIPMGYEPKDENWDSFNLQVVGRLKPGVSIAQADAEIKTLNAGYLKEHPKELDGLTMRAMPFKERLIGDIRPMMMMLQAAVVFVLLIACANVANLMLARAAARRREISLRMALGASRGRITRQLLTESVLVAFAGATLGILLAHWGNRLWMASIPLEMPMWLDFRIDAPVLLFTVGVTVVSGLLFGFAPALHASDGRLSEALREGTAQAGSSRGRNRLRSGLVVAEVALSLVLLVGAGLMIRSFMNRYEMQNHLRVDGVLTGAVLLPFATYPENHQKVEFFRGVLPQIATIPGVEAVSGIQALPLGRNGWGRAVIAEDAKDPDPKNAIRIRYGVVFAGYFNVLGIPLKAGRDFNAFDTPASERVAIVSEAFAKKLWPGKSPLGRHFKFAGQPDSLGWTAVVGVAANVLQNVEDDEKRFEQAYVPHTQDPIQMMSLAVQSNADPAALAAKIRGILRARDSDQALVDVRNMREHVAFSMWMHRLFTSLFGTFAVIALIIAGVGIFGVMSYSVGQRTQEIGIRMALGAEPAAVVRMVTMQALMLTGIGIVIGLAGAFAVTRFMESQLFGVSATDPPTFTVVCVLLAVSGVVAAWLPAMRASRVDPMVALRHE
ncbi:MAG: ABC transporter permease [Candidatus Eisenbacteria bacterium]